MTPTDAETRRNLDRANAAQARACAIVLYLFLVVVAWKIGDVFLTVSTAALIPTIVLFLAVADAAERGRRSR